jgi:hypothetical protein
LQKLAKTCKYYAYDNLEGEIIKERIVIGVKSNTIHHSQKVTAGGGKIDVAEGN